MRAATDLLSQYADVPPRPAQHRQPLRRRPDDRLRGRRAAGQAGLHARRLALTPAWLVFAAVAVWYLTRGNLRSAWPDRRGRALLIAAAHRVGDSGTGAWLAWGMGFFVVGWAIQFVGHWYEGRKPAFVDDLIGLLVGPMFVVAEALFCARLGQGAAGRDRAACRPDACLRDLARIA